MEEVVKVTKKKAKYIYGVVTHKLNFREEPNLKSEILDVLNRGTKIKIDLNKSTDDFYATCYRSIDGYVLKKFIDVSNNNKEQKEENKGE